MSEWITVIPAYGADYKSQKDVQAAWNSGADFQIMDFGPNMGRYINKEDKANYAPNAHIMVRYNQQRKVFEVK